MNQVLSLYRDSTWFIHSDPIPEWWQNDRMMPKWEVSQNSIFLSTSKNTFIPPHLVILRQFRMAWNENNNGEISFRGHSIHFYSIPFTLIILECCWNDGMRVKWGIFLKQGKTLNSKISLVSPSFGHSLSKSYASYDHSIHLGIIPHCDLILGQYKKLPFAWPLNCWMIQEWAEWPLNEWIRCCLFRRDSTWFRSHPSIPVHSFNIQVILISFHHSIVILSFLTHSTISSHFWHFNIIPLSSYHSQFIMALYFHSFAISSFPALFVTTSSFLCHSIIPSPF